MLEIIKIIWVKIAGSRTELRKDKTLNIPSADNGGKLISFRRSLIFGLLLDLFRIDQFYVLYLFSVSYYESKQIMILLKILSTSIKLSFYFMRLDFHER